MYSVGVAIVDGGKKITPEEDRVNFSWTGSGGDQVGLVSASMYSRVSFASSGSGSDAIDPQPAGGATPRVTVTPAGSGADVVSV